MPDFEIVALDDSFHVLHECDSSTEAFAWLSGYIRREDAGGWDCIQVYDRRGADSELLRTWQRGG